jgi:creatinine amidohydrolase
MRFEDLTTEEAAQARDAGAIVLLPVGSIEPHGPHLPLSTDVLIAEETAHRAAARLEEAGIWVLILPTIRYSTVEFSAGFTGAVGAATDNAAAMLADVLTSLLEQGFRAVALVNAHLEPAHIASLRAAVTSAAERTRRNPIFPDITRRSLAARLTEEFRSGACHAGRYETSLVLAVRPDLVKDDVRAGLPPIDTSLVDAIQDGARTFLEAGIDRAYCGDPAAASAEEGEETYEILGAIVAEAVLAELEDPEPRH